ncbi:MAG: hypothetical protein DRQ47_04805 [Gammaproteobacteria bacterium]|nr:MAG: hypothetical protein DRQ47_04805 [Gammaproteobacteria bacterium]
MRSQFKYHRPASVKSAVAMKSELGEEAYFWAGGTDLMLQWKHEKIHPQHCIDITSIPNLNQISHQPDLLCIGGLTNLSDIERADSDDPYLQTLASVARKMATQQTRTLATIAGNLCNGSPAADLLPPLIAMGAYLKVVGSNGCRELPVEQLLLSPGRTSLEQSELVTEICIPIETNQRASSYRRIDRTVVDIALVSASAAITVDSNQRIDSAKVSLGAVAPTVIRSGQAEHLLKGCVLKDMDGEFLESVGQAAMSDATPIDDVRASADYRRAMVKVLVKQVLEDILLSLSGDTND